MQIVGASWGWMGIAGAWRGGLRLVDSCWIVRGGLKQSEAGSVNLGGAISFGWLALVQAGGSWLELS